MNDAIDQLVGEYIDQLAGECIPQDLKRLIGKFAEDDGYTETIDISHWTVVHRDEMMHYKITISERLDHTWLPSSVAIPNALSFSIVPKSNKWHSIYVEHKGKCKRYQVFPRDCYLFVLREFFFDNAERINEFLPKFEETY